MIKNIIFKNKHHRFLVAYSGGIDSTVLLHQMIIMKKIIPTLKIRAIHINHNIHPFSNTWSKHCQLQCENYKIPLTIENISINIKKNNIEERLRKKRYNIFYTHLLKNEILLTGHHLNDQSETLLLSLKRGSGITGLSSMSEESIFGLKKIIRPLLYVNKKTIKKWAKQKKLTWIEDTSNINNKFDRNFLRNQIIPILEKRWPFFTKNCAQTAYICRKEKILLDSFLKKELSLYIESDYSLNISQFHILNQEKCKAIIRLWISRYNIKLPSYQTIEYIYNHMIFSKRDANPQIILKKQEIRRYKKRLYIFIKKPIIKNTILFWHHSQKYLTLPNELGILEKNTHGIYLPMPQENELINIRFQYEGLILIQGRHKKRKIQKIWQEKKIPPWLRTNIPLLFYNNTFISAIGVFIVNIKNKNKKKWSISWVSKIKNTKEDDFQFI